MAERDILLKRFAGGDTWDVLYPKTKVNNVDGLYNRLKDSPYYVVGTGTTSGTWLGTIDGLTSYYDGLMINYKIPVAGASTTTLNINGLGAKTVRRTASAAVTTHLPVNSIMPLVYTTISGVGYFLWADYDSTRSEISEANIINKTSSTISAISGRRLEYFLTNTTNARAVGWDNKANASHAHTIAQITNLQTELNSKEQVFTKNTAFNKSFGNTAGTVTQGNDSRLSNARASNDVLAWAKIGNSDLLPTNKLPIIPTSKLPALAITDTFEVATQSAMTTLTAQKGDIAIRSDINKTFILAAEPASTLGNWKELKTPTDLVLSVAGLKGAITSSSLKTSLSLNNVENKSSATIRSEIVIGNLPTGTSGSTIAFGNHTHTPSSIGAEPAITKGTASQYFDGTMSLKTFPTSMTPTSHKHNASDIDAGTLGVARGGTGLSSVAADRYLRGNTAGALIARTYEQVKSDLGLHNVNNTSDANKPISTAVATALAGKSSTSHKHNASDIDAGTLPNSRIGDNSIGPNKLSRSDTAGVVMKGLGTIANPEWGTLSVSEITGLNTALNAKAPTTHSHTIAQVTGLQAELNAKSGTGHTHSSATQNAAGFLSAADKIRLDGIATGAQVNVGTNLSQGARSTTTLRIDSSTGSNLTLPAVTTSLAGLMTSTDKTRLNVLHSLLEENTANNVVDSINEVLAIFNNYPEGADLVTALAGKVDKVTGKVLSSNDYTTAEKNKLAGIDTGAQKNVATNLGINTSGTTNTITSSTGSNTIITGATYTQAGLVTTGEQTWNGIKTFSSIPVLPTITPSNVNHAVSKGYVDDKTNGIMKQVSWNSSTGTMVVEVN